MTGFVAQTVPVGLGLRLRSREIKQVPMNLGPAEGEVVMDEGRIAEARANIAAQRGELRGWRPLVIGEIAVTALQVLGMVRGEPGMVGMRAVVAARGTEAFAAHGLEVAERLLRARAVLAPGDPFEVESVGEWHEGDGAAAHYPAWPWRWLVFHVPERQLPAIAGLATDTVPAP